MTDEVDEMSAASRGSGANHSAIPNSWIPVTERLPEEHTIVVGLMRAVGEWVEVLCGRKGNHWWPEHQYEYWTPLPQIPQSRK
jgi:hypothetical protein